MKDDSKEIILRSRFYYVLWAGKWRIAAAAVGVAILSGILAVMSPNIYRAEVLLAVNNAEESSGIAGLAAQVGIPIGLSGLGLGGSAPDKKALGLEILSSRKFITRFIENHKLTVPLLASKGWNAESGELILNSSRYDASQDRWKRRFGNSERAAPSDEDAFEAFTEILSIDDRDTNGFVRVAIEHVSPSIAKDWIDWLIADLNATMLREDVDEANRAIEYLTAQARATSLADLQAVFYRLIEEQTKVVLLAEIRDEYLFKTVDPGVIAEKPERPNRLLIVLLGALAGLGFAVLFVVSRESLYGN